MDPRQFVHPLEDQPYDVRNAEPVENELYYRSSHDDRREKIPAIGRNPEPSESPCKKSPPTCCKQEESSDKRKKKKNFVYDDGRKQRDSPCAQCCEIRRVKPTSARTEQLAKPMERRVRETLKQKMNVLPLRKQENLVKQIEYVNATFFYNTQLHDELSALLVVLHDVAAFVYAVLGSTIADGEFSSDVCCIFSPIPGSLQVVLRIGICDNREKK
ncbi:unnamed protein product [Trichogramma brassicae]|uniref:Uncharacterized protein n=1 Tax=Trichogramma brassicae TaxID=86971 RepID=A0A6H5I9F8_9HYME|nr:unnamed protein product [Trichogramma brassicae]